MGISEDREKRLEASGVTHHLAKGEVEESFRLVLQHGINPYTVSAVQMSAMLDMRQSKYADAEEKIKKALAMRQDAIAWKMRGDTCYLTNRFSEAEGHYKTALKFAAESPEIVHDLAVSIVSQGRIDEALEWFKKACDLVPGRKDFEHHYSMMLILGGRIKEGWEMMKSRLEVPGVCGSYPYPEKYWNGEDLTGKRIVVRSEQGWGDTIMFSRYFPLLAARASKVYFYGQRAILSLIENMHPEVICWPNDAPVPMDFDYHVNVMCLPRLVGIDVPSPQPKKTQGKGVGICWFGSPTHKADGLRSVPVEMFSRFADVLDERLYSLGYGFFWNMENNIAVSDNKPDFLEYCITDKRDWLETANFVKDLDLVISVDTAIAHLAATLGVETWLLLPHTPDFRWGMTGSITPWYPAMRLYRCPAVLEWKPVFDQVEQDLRDRYASPKEAVA